jgi:hypothetical protein
MMAFHMSGDVQSKGYTKMTHTVKVWTGLAIVGTVAVCGCEGPRIDSQVMKEHAERVRSSGPFQYPLDGYFPEIPVTDTDPPKGAGHHAGEDSFAPAGTPVYAIGSGIVRYSGKMDGYGWLIIIDHPEQDVYSLYGHLSPRRWQRGLGEVRKGECIAYLGEAEEAETMVSHLHCGLRLGQQADYPRRGERRWMAGYTDSRPDLVGWFHPSELIGETDSMRHWKRLIRKREDIVVRRNLHVSDFRVSVGMYNEKEDLDQKIGAEFGNDFRLADWSELLTLGANIEAWADSLGLAEGEENSLLVSNEGYRIWLGRQYYISRFNHKRPRHFLAHDSMDDDLVCLGSWFGLRQRALAVRRVIAPRGVGS